MTFEQWWKSHGQYCRAGGGDYEKSFAYAAWCTALLESRTENGTSLADTPKREVVAVRCCTDKYAREEFLAEARKKGYDGVQHYITVMAECYEVPLDVARSCFIAAESYRGAFGEFIKLLKEWKRKTGK